MKISKYLHSCLLFEKESFRLLVDPGNFTFAEGFVEVDEFKDVDAIIITHIHADHLDKENLGKIVSLSGAPIYTVKQVMDDLAKYGLQSNLIPETIGPFEVTHIPVKHEAILDSPLPEMAALVIDEKVLHCVDSFDEKLLAYTGIQLLISPVMAPFCTEMMVAAFANKITPKQLLPVHDGYAKPFFVKARYKNYKQYFEKQGIVFHDHMSEIGASVEV